MARTKEEIITAIQHIAAELGSAPGKQIFAQKTGIEEWEWSGIHFARWGDAVEAAGFVRNRLNEALPKSAVVDAFLECARAGAKVPTMTELRIYKAGHRGFPSHNRRSLNASQHWLFIPNQNGPI